MALSTPYLARAISVALWNASTETYGTPVSVNNIQGISFEPTMDNDEMQVLGANEESLAVLKGMDVSMQFGGLDWSSLAIMQGTNDASSGGATHVNEDEGGQNLPYFGLVAAISLHGGREAHVYLPKCQLDSRVPLDISDQNQFVMPEIDAKALRLRLADGTTFPIRSWREYETETTLPTDFDTAFGL